MRKLAFGVVALGLALTTVGSLTAGDDGKALAIEKDRKIYEGAWRVVALVVDGNVFDRDDKKFSTTNHQDGSWSLYENDSEISKGPSQIDPTKSPKTIDFIPSQGAGEGKQFLGIYELGEKTRKLCFVESGTDRPTEFSSVPGSKRILVTFERVTAK